MLSKRPVRNWGVVGSRWSRILFLLGPTEDWRLPAMHPTQIGRNFPCKSILLPFFTPTLFYFHASPEPLSPNPPKIIFSLCCDVVKFSAGLLPCLSFIS